MNYIVTPTAAAIICAIVAFYFISKHLFRCIGKRSNLQKMDNLNDNAQAPVAQQTDTQEQVAAPVVAEVSTDAETTNTPTAPEVAVVEPVAETVADVQTTTEPATVIDPVQAPVAAASPERDAAMQQQAAGVVTDVATPEAVVLPEQPTEGPTVTENSLPNGVELVEPTVTPQPVVEVSVPSAVEAPVENQAVEPVEVTPADIETPIVAMNPVIQPLPDVAPSVPEDEKEETVETDLKDDDTEGVFDTFYNSLPTTDNEGILNARKLSQALLEGLILSLNDKTLTGVHASLVDKVFGNIVDSQLLIESVINSALSGVPK